MEGGSFGGDEIPEDIREMVMDAIRSSMSQEGFTRDDEELVQVIMRTMGSNMEEGEDDDDERRSRRGSRNKNNKKNPERQ